MNAPHPVYSEGHQRYCFVKQRERRAEASILTPPPLNPSRTRAPQVVPLKVPLAPTLALMLP